MVHANEGFLKSEGISATQLTAWQGLNDTEQIVVMSAYGFQVIRGTGLHLK
jgi:hypothetical protein